MNLRAFFDELSLTTIDNFVSSGREEDLYLDFKTISKADLSDAEDKRTLAKALAGFANSSGGIVVWGVDARPTNGVDCACGKKPIAPLAQFIAKLNEFTGSFVSPIVDGVVHKSLQQTNDSGFAATLIPESLAGPHMAKGRENRYIKRSGGAFYTMEHFDLEDMFGRRKKPQLLFDVDVRLGSRSHSSNGVSYDVRLILGIRNSGRGVARSPYMAINVMPPYAVNSWGLDGNNKNGLPLLPSSGYPFPYRYGASADFVVHQDTVHQVASIKFPMHDSASSLDELRIEYELAAEDTATIRDTYKMTGTDLLAEVKKRINETPGT